MNHNLIPCPFCGREDTPTLTTAKELEMCRNEDCTLDYRNCWSVAVVCDYNKGGCGGCGGYGSTEQEAVDKWNERAEKAERCGNWAQKGHEYVCGECGGFAPLTVYGEHIVTTKYCPHCGARMDGGSI